MEKFMANSDIIWYNSIDMFHEARGRHFNEYKDLPGFSTFRHLFGFFAANFSFTDRTCSVVSPVKTTILPACVLPEFKKVDYDFDELCQKRARWLLDHCIATDRKLVVMYSGGIDSTTILVSIFKVATEKELNERLVVLLNNYSIGENPNFYNDYIIKKCPIIDSSNKQNAFLGNDKYVVINGEGGDQLFGSAVNNYFFNASTRGGNYVFSEPTHEKIVASFDSWTNDIVATEKIIKLLDKVIASSPIPITTVYHYFWWINFALKWQSVYARTPAYTAARFQPTLKLEENFFTFFHFPEAQLWAMNNTDKFIKDEWKTYKYIMKDIIYDYNKDAYYRDNKLKVGSLQYVVALMPLAKCVGLNNEFHYDKYPDGIWEMNNDFV
jgi:hypothetical protein